MYFELDRWSSASVLELEVYGCANAKVEIYGEIDGLLGSLTLGATQNARTTITKPSTSQGFYAKLTSLSGTVWAMCIAVNIIP
jgi:hypothetical protein